MSWTWIALLIEILGVIAVFVLVFLIARSLIRYANSLKKGGSSSKQAAEDKKSLFMIYKNVTRYIEVKNRIIDALHGRAPYSPGGSDIRGASAGRSRSVRCAF
ncbi:hypothetical protein [Bifidobacterium catenulatum]|uniref:hypothetical protein n=1 Tax=Bifidobacterium catenulatum TaxID=1686 RepID=UPI002480E70E|nr:hypothetical protein [Bifidobacterium catenulatum]MDH7883676.1 hypothetical protein [Bifidobacterium catenulatum subsp. catenulatum]